MYNRYIPDGAVYTRIPMEEPAPPSAPSRPHGPPPQGGPGREGANSLGEWLSHLGLEGDGLRGLLGRVGLNGMDSGDLLLLLIVLLLWSEGEDMDLVLALGLALVLGLGEKGKKE